ncbi:LysR family transcriptional regulator [Sinorhizobium meliloti]|uniref:LysR substrate-binding domain-containing protein n=1 Tax=Rhizobium meliloti TaxID=382 RepID=UPI0003DBE921|nr:LysR family transcriptional regulator [Sinorhizobium meliloti]ARS71053.1 LysR family transcriptional regulator [Sinorhizobium meliloti RU11/001]
MELRHLRYVLATARNGSFSAASHELNVQQPIVSKRVRELEDELGVLLFDRSTAGARLTSIGEEFVLSARRIVDEIDLLAHRAGARRSGKSGRVVVGFYASLSSGNLRAAVREFRDQYPDIETELIETPFLDLSARVLTDTVDVIIQLGDTTRGDALASTPLWSERLVVALPEHHPLADRSIVYWLELKDERFLISHHQPGPEMHALLLRHLAAPSDHPEILTRRLSRESILSEVASGEGITLQCESATCLSGLGVIFRPVHDGNGVTRLGYVAAWKPDNRNPALKIFIDAIKQQC